jgi:beta-galactosidase
LQVSNPFPNGRTLLHFEAAGQRARIYIGAEQVAHHAGGYDEFLVDITDACRSVATGERVHLAVLCDNSRDINALPSDLSDFTIYGGLYRPVHLLYVPSASLEAVHTHVQFEPGTSAQVRVTARLYAPGGSHQKLALQTLITSPEGEVLYSATDEHEPWSGELQLASFEVKQPSVWSPDSPALYRCDVQMVSPNGSSTTSHRFGIRHTRFQEHGPFYLNGSRLLLRGTHRHEDHAGCAAAMSSDLIRREMTMIKEMGANFIRLAHYQQRRLVLDLCDELGILVWEELPWCRSGVGSSAFQEQGRTLLRTMIDQHRNHPGILCWGLGNEDDWPTELNGQNHAAIRQYMQELRDLAHSLDPDRPT